MYNQYYDNMRDFGFMGSLMMIIFWVLIIILIIWLIKGFRFGNKSELQDSRKALDILEERYAKSEIDKKEFEEKMNQFKNNLSNLFDESKGLEIEINEKLEHLLNA